MKKVIFILILLIVSQLGFAQKTEEIKDLLESKTYVFKAINVNPMNGSSISLDGSFSVKIDNDTIVSYLPFYGRAYSIAYGSRVSGMDFTQPIENYTFEKSKKGYLIKVKIKNGSDSLDYTFHISENGTSTLNVNSINRQSISYYGNIEKFEERK